MIELVQAYDTLMQCGVNVVSMFNEIDSDNDGSISQDELVDFFSTNVGSGRAMFGTQCVATKLLTKVTGVPSPDEVTISTNVPADVVNAKTKVKVKFTLDVDSPSSLYAKERRNLEQGIMQVLAGTNDLRGMTAVTEYSSGSVVVSCTVFISSDEKRGAAEANAATAFATPVSANSALNAHTSGYSILAVEPPIVSSVLGTEKLQYLTPSIVGGVFVVLLGMACIFATCWASTSRKKVQARYTGCCASGCCSSYALPAWVWLNVLAAACLLGAAAFIYVNMDKTTTSLVCVVDRLFALLQLGKNAQGVTATLDQTLDIIKPIKPYMKYLGVAAIVPACLAAVLLLLASALALCWKPGKGMCCAKFFLLWAQAVILVCVVFYGIFAALGPVTQLQTTQTTVMSVMGICETTVPAFRQTMIASRQAINAALATPGVASTDLVDLRATFNDAMPAVDHLTHICSCVTVIIHEWTVLFFPGVCAVLAALFALYVSCHTCCAANCCARPRRRVIIAKAKDEPSHQEGHPANVSQSL